MSLEIVKNIENKNSDYIKLLDNFSINLSNNTLTFFDIQNFFKELGEYSANQFLNIEKAIKEFGIDKRQEEIHLKNQKLFIQELAFICSFVSEDINKVKVLLNFLLYWTDLEIFKQNRGLIMQIELIEKGMEPSVAYELTNISNEDSMFARSVNKFINTLIKNNNELVDKNRALNDRIKNLEEKIEKSKSEFYLQVDNLTNLPNRSQGIKTLELLLSKNKENSVGIFLISFTNYNQILEKFGSKIANGLTLTLITLIDSITRSDDIIYSMKRGEFMVICPNLNEASAINIANSLLDKAKNNSIIKSLLNEHQNLDINIGIALSDRYNDSKIMLQKADFNLKEAKKEEGSSFKI